MPITARRRLIAKSVMVFGSLTWIIASVFAFCVWFVSLVIHNRAGMSGYFSLTHQIPTVEGDLALLALITMPASTVAAFILSSLTYHDDRYALAFLYMALPVL